VDALIPRLGDHERAVFRPVAVLALHFEIERAPPEPIIPFRSRAPAIGFSKRQIFKQAVGMERRQRFLHLVRVLGRQMPVDDCLKCFIHE
jgi:hypothetical protein